MSTLPVRLPAKVGLGLRWLVALVFCLAVYNVCAQPVPASEPTIDQGALDPGCRP